MPAGVMAMATTMSDGEALLTESRIEGDGVQMKSTGK